MYPRSNVTKMGVNLPILFLLLQLLTFTTASNLGKPTEKSKSPNFIFILTDDQDRILGRDGYSSYGSMEIMPILKEKLIDEGATVDNFLVNTPICCPSRTEFFTGRYFHNVESREKGNCMWADTTIAGSNTTGLFGLLKTHGYNVGVFGKVTNNQEPMLNQLGGEANSVDYIDSPLDPDNFMGPDYWRYWIDNRTTFTETISSTDPIFTTAYQTTQIGNRTLRWLESAIDEWMEGDVDGRPFFAYIGPHAPHFSAQPAPWYEHAFDDIDAPWTPNYNVSSPDKAQHVRQNPPLDDRVKCWENQHFRDRWSSLLSVEDIINDVYEILEARLALENTYIIYSSDHGYKQGQWRLGTSKQHPYETDIRVPFIIRGPGIQPGKNITSILAGNVDVMPTILDLAGLMDITEDEMDGKSMKNILMQGDEDEDTSNFRQYFLNEYLSVDTYYNDHSAIWQDGTTTSDLCQTDPNTNAGPVGPDPNTKPEDCIESEGIGDGNCWFLDSQHSNSWRQLRIMNESLNWNYVEYDPTWKFEVKDESGAGLQHYELYDITEDPYQMENLYSTTSMEIKTALHQQLNQYFQCKGQSCP